MKHITLEQAKQLKIGTILYQTTETNIDGTPVRWKVNGKVKTWKREPDYIQVPIKYGLKICSYLTQDNLSDLSLTPYWQKRFWLISDAKAFQRKKRKERFRTQLEVHEAICNPYFLVRWCERKIEHSPVL